MTDLHKAVMNGNIEQVKSLLQTGNVDVNAKDKYGNTALHLAAFNPPVFLAIMNNGGDVNAVNNDEQIPRVMFTPLHILNADPKGLAPLNVLWQLLLCH
jgi:ankyrin repeat protein